MNDYDLSNNSCEYCIDETDNCCIHSNTCHDKKKCCCKPCPQGPTGPTGPTGHTGSILGSYDTLAELKCAHPVGNQGDSYLVGGDLYVWDIASNSWRLVGNLQGPTGPTGPTGPAGAILGSYETLAELIVAHPVGNPGDSYLVGGELYVWDSASNSWKRVGNLQGPTGPTGPTGPAGIISGSYETLEELIAAHPVGNPGDSYLVGGELYVWDSASNSWKPVGNLQGPTGPTGPVGTILGTYETLAELIVAHPIGNQGDSYLVGGELYTWDAESISWKQVGNLQGPTGPTGPAGTISGSYETLEELIAAHPVGNQGDAYLVGGELYVWNPESNSWELVGNLQGPTGPTGPVGTILGTYETLADLIADHPTGNQGDAYLVGGELYIWNSESNSWEAVGNLQGPTGPEASSFAIIPFASQIAPLTYVENGIPTRVSLLGFGYGDQRGNLTTLDDYSIPISSSDGSFNLGLSDNNNKQLVFSLPFDMAINSIALTTGNWAEFPPQGTVFPYVQLYSASPTSNTFVPIEDAVAVPEVGLGPGTVQEATMRFALKEDLEIRLPAGTRIAIGGLMRIEGDTANREYWLYFTGAIGMTRWIQ